MGGEQWGKQWYNHSFRKFLLMFLIEIGDIVCGGTGFGQNTSPVLQMSLIQYWQSTLPSIERMEAWVYPMIGAYNIDSGGNLLNGGITT